MKYVIVGNGVAAVHALEAIREVDRNGSVTIVSEEPCLAYGRVFIDRVIDERIELDDILIRPADFYARSGCEVLLGKRATCIDRDLKRVRLNSGGWIPYDRLLLATGASARVPKIPGIGLDGVGVLRTVDDARRISIWNQKACRAVVLGAGPVGLYSSEVLARNGVGVSLVVSSKHVLSTIASKTATAPIERKMIQAGIEFHYGRTVTEIRGDHRVRAVILDNGLSLACDMVVIGKGVRPNVELALEADLEVAAGICVDAHLRTGDPDIYAAGDVAEGYDRLRKKPRINAMWPNAVFQGRVAGLNMAGRSITADGYVNLNTGKFFGISFAVVGLSQPGQCRHTSIRLKDNRAYGRLVLSEKRDGSRCIVGAVLVGHTKGMGVLQALIQGEIDVAPFIDTLVQSGLSHAAISARVMEKLPGVSQLNSVHGYAQGE